MLVKDDCWDIRDEDDIWKELHFHKIPNVDEKRVKGNRLEVATEIGLIKAGLSYIDTSKISHRGNVPDFITKNTAIECKNWLGAVDGRYRIHLNRYNVQIHRRFESTSSALKILIIPRGANWDRSALRAARQDGLIIITVPPVRTDEDIIPASNIIATALSSYVV